VSWRLFWELKYDEQKMNRPTISHFQRNFSIVCKVGWVTIGGDGTSKKEAKRKSAAEMLKHLSEAPEGARNMVSTLLNFFFCHR
jgi:hypothetical protein